jgi:hypothetical protein
MGVPAKMIQTNLQWIFDPMFGDLMFKQTWDLFLLWFHPLDETANKLQTNSLFANNDSLYHNADTESIKGYKINHILKICSPLWFHGFLSGQEAQSLLKGKVDGTFLVRFSTNVLGTYALSVSFQGEFFFFFVFGKK